MLATTLPAAAVHMHVRKSIFVRECVRACPQLPPSSAHSLSCDDRLSGVEVPYVDYDKIQLTIERQLELITKIIQVTTPTAPLNARIR